MGGGWGRGGGLGGGGGDRQGGEEAAGVVIKAREFNFKSRRCSINHELTTPEVLTATMAEINYAESV